MGCGDITWAVTDCWIVTCGGEKRRRNLKLNDTGIDCSQNRELGRNGDKNADRDDGRSGIDVVCGNCWLQRFGGVHCIECVALSGTNDKERRMIESCCVEDEINVGFRI